jgi:uncharacterized protein (DUF1015 family)
MQSQNRTAIIRIVNHLNSTFGVELSEQLISQVENIASFNRGSRDAEVDDSELIRVIRMLLEEEVFLPAEVIEIDDQEIEDDIIYVSRNKSLGELNRLLQGTSVRVTQLDTSSEIVKLVGVM